MRDILQVLLVAALVLIGGALAYRVVFRAGEVEPLSIQRVDGAVEHVSPDGRRAAEEGAVLGQSDRVIAGEGGRVVLGLGEQTRLVLHESSTLRVLGQDRDGLQVELEGGRVQATVRPGTGALAVRAGGREVRAEDASFAVGLGEEGTTLVEASLGEVALSGFGELTEITEGQRLTVSGDAQPSVAPIPQEMLLDVRWPEEVRVRAELVRLEGSTHPGASVVASGEGGDARTFADAEGRFALELPLKEGSNDLHVVAVDPLGKEQEVTWSVTRDSQGPTGEFTIAPF
ncbi:MAG: FecR domain-containing protein [Alphaproteobacteria bacterium]|nr:FecR domain-containing protein [Alphaproteobacteria bacterium]